MSARLVSLRKRHSLLVLLSAERTKVVTMGAPLNKNGLVTFLDSSIFWSEYSGFNVFLSWWSIMGVSKLSVQKVIPVRACRSSFEADLIRW